jgi:hypothetical protein
VPFRVMESRLATTNLRGNKNDNRQSKGMGEMIKVLET